MILLAIDTATECCSAALWVDGKLYQSSVKKPRMHAELILPLVTEIIKQSTLKFSDIQGIVVGHGPGAFTGVRIGVGVAQGMALAWDIPVLGVSNLQTLAYSAYGLLNTQQSRVVLVATDARMQEVYWAKYKITASIIERLSDEKVSKASEVDLTGIDAHIGSGFEVYPELIEYNQQHPMSYPAKAYSQAQDMLKMIQADFDDLASDIDFVEPVYLREP